jgi:bifunctional enzyme CysN/CysC
MLRIVTAGSVDDGKSTLVGRLLHDAGGLYQDHLEALRKLAGRPQAPLDLSLVTDGLKAEREQGITIDVAYRYFDTPARRFVIADTPGHEQYTRNMATGASTADLAVILVDATQGVVTQSKRHGFIVSLLGVPRVVVAVNKMDKVGFSREVFEAIRAEYEAFASRLAFSEMVFIPMSAILGDNVVTPGAHMPWYEGPALLAYLERVYVGGDANLVDFRLPIQNVVRASGEERAYCGTVASGVVRPGDEVVILPSGVRTRVARIVGYRDDLAEAHSSQAVAITLADDVDAARGDLIAHPGNVPRAARALEAMVVWMSAEPLVRGRPLLVKHATRTVKGECAAVSYRIDPDTLRRASGEELALNEIGRVSIALTQSLHVDVYKLNRSTGSFVVIDPATHETLGAGMIVARQASAREEAQSRPRAVTVWLTGLPGAGKSTIARALEARFAERGRPCAVLDGDDLRSGLNRDLGFSREDRRENIRRTAEVARMMNDAGVVAICALVSPYREDREAARAAIGPGRFLEVHLSADLATCEKRDPKGLYRKARRGELQDLTGVASPYEAPDAPAIALDTGALDLEECVRAVLGLAGLEA